MRLVAPYEPIRAEDHNDLLGGVRRITPVESPLPRASSSFPHPWLTRVVPGDQDGKWKVTMKAGFINDVEAPVAYLAQNDSRGWNMPDSFPAARLHAGICERSWREQIDPPFLLIDQNQDFITVADAARPAAFQSAADWKKELRMASVYLAARPVSILAGKIVPALYRTWAGKLPMLPSYPYGIYELARIYLLIDPSTRDAETQVKQIEHWDLWDAAVEPVAVLPDFQPLDANFGGYGLGLADGAVASYNIIGDSLTKQVNEALANLQTATSSVEAWSV